MATTDKSRLDRVESEVGAIRSEIGGMKDEISGVKSDVKGLGGILVRIEQGMLRAQEQQHETEQAKRHSPVALATVLVTIMSMLIGGAWVIGSSTARTEVRLNDTDIRIGEITQLRNRELDVLERRLDRDEDRGRSYAQPTQTSQ